MPTKKTKPTIPGFFPLEPLPAKVEKKVTRCWWDLAGIARSYPNRARFVIDYAVRHLPEKEAPKVIEDVRRCLEYFKQRKAGRGPGRPRAAESHAVINRHFQVAILRHGSKAPWSTIALYFEMCPTNSNIRTLTRQRDSYAGLVYTTLLNCGVDPKGKNLDQVLSRKNDSWQDTQDKLSTKCGISLQKAPVGWAKFAKELFLLAHSKRQGKLYSTPSQN